MTPQNFLENDDVLRFFVADQSLINGSVIAVHIFEIAESLTIDLDVKLLYSKNEKNYRIRFQDIIEYAFYYRNDRYFYYITNLKFFKDGDSYYISLDPDESVNSKSEDDDDVILSKRIQAFVLNS